MKFFAMKKKVLKSINNPFKFGTIVDGDFFTNRIKEIKVVRQILSSPNHMTIIAPRRFGKTSLIKKVINAENRKSIFLDIQLLNDIEDFATQYLKRIYAIYPVEKIKNYIRNFKVIPTISFNPVTDEFNVSFSNIENEQLILEDVLNLLEKITNEKNRAIVVFDEFQDIFRIGTGLDRFLRSIMQNHKHINYIFLGSQESMMQKIFEDKKSPFYHFGQLIYLDKIEKQQFKKFIVQNINFNKIASVDDIAEEILYFSNNHPYYTQQLAYQVWNLLSLQDVADNSIVKKAVNEIINIHDYDYERIWVSFNKTDKKILSGMAIYNLTPFSAAFGIKIKITSTSTLLSGVKRLMSKGYIIKSENKYQIDDPFFVQWIIKRRH